MYELIQDFLVALVDNTLSFFGDAISGNSDYIIDCAFHAEEKINEFMGKDVGDVYMVIQAFALYLVLLKFLKKGFSTYILWNDGDSDMDPFIMLTGFFQAVIITLCFGTIYDLMIDVSIDMINKMMEKISTVDLSIVTLTVQLSTGGGVAAIVGIIFLIAYFILFIKTLKKGVEIFILKMGISLACVGLMDSDGGVFKAYIKKFFQEIFSIMLQIILLKLALFAMLGSHYLWGGAIMSLALSAPQFLNEFIMVSSGGGGMSKISSTMYMASMAKNLTR